MAEANDPVLHVQRRSTTGKKVKQLRREGIAPGNVYGRGLESVAVQAQLSHVQQVFRQLDRNSVVQMTIDAAEEIPVVLRDVQRHPVSGDVLHLDFYQVDLTRVIHSEARLALTGEPEAVANGGTLVQSLEYLMLEALPTAMPSEIEVDVSGLSDFGHSVLVRDLVLGEGVRALTDGAIAVATVLAPRVAEEDEVEEVEGAEPFLDEESDTEPAETEEA